MPKKQTIALIAERRWKARDEMTREEIIGGLKFTVEMFLFNPNTGENREEYELNDMDKTTIDACKGAIELLKQEPTVGHWEKINESVGIYKYRCDQCGAYHRAMYDYCPTCGAKMVESQESEDEK